MFKSAQYITRVLRRYGIIAAAVVVTVGFTLFRSQTYTSASVLVHYNSNNVWNQPIVSVPQKSQSFGRNTARGSTDLPSIPGNWNLIFNDTFQNMMLDSSKWNTCYWWA